MTDKRDFFISFTSDDLEIATAINDALRDAGFSTWFHPTDKPLGAGIADWMEVALEASTQMLALCSDAYFDREKGYSRAERQSMFWEDPTNNDPLLILVKVADCTFPRLIAQNEYISLTGLQRPEAAAELVKRLQDEEQRKARNEAARINTSRQQPAIFNVLGGPNPLFTGRDVELSRLHEQIKSGAATAITAVQGMGGIGKTSLAREYAHRYGTAARFGGVWWIDADTPSGVLNGYDELAQRLGNQIAREPDQEKTAAKVRDWLAQQKDTGPWLVIFDNAPDDESVAQWLPQGSARVIVTTRYAGFEGAEKLSLDVWEDETTAAFLRERTKRGTKVEALSLAARLGGLPLAAEQAGAYLAKQSTLSFAAYEDRLVQMLDKAPGTLPGSYGKSLYGTFRTALEEVAGRDHGETARGLLNLCAYLSPDGVELEILKECASQTEILPDPLCSDLVDEVQCAEAVAALTTYALIRVEPVAEWGDTLILHRLLGEIARDMLDAAEQAKWSEAAVMMVRRLMPGEAIDPSDWPLCTRLAPHARAMLPLEADKGPMGQALAYVLNQAAVYLNARGDYDGATMLLRRRISIGETVYSGDPLKNAVALGNLAGRLEKREVGWAEAEEIHARALEIFEAHLPADDPLIAAALSNMAWIPWQKKDFAKAEDLYLRALKIDKAAHGVTSTQYATRLNNLGTVYSQWANETGRVNMRQKERDAKEEAANILRALRGMRHPEVAATKNNLGVMYANLGDLAGAAKQMTQAAAIDLSLDLLTHPQTQSHIANLIQLWTHSNQSDKAARLQAGDFADILPIVEQIEAEHRAWVAEDPENRDFGPPSPVTGARE